jgi:hypothetical protein
MTIKNRLLLTILLIIPSFVLSAEIPEKISLLESNIVLPLRDNEGKSLNEAHTWLKQTMLSNWSGYGAVEANGGWVSPSGQVMEDTNIVYTVAIPCSKKERSKLVEIATKLKSIAKQEAIYLKECTGAVKLI